jgi:DNA-binding response OmpR family regulator
MRPNEQPDTSARGRAAHAEAMVTHAVELEPEQEETRNPTVTSHPPRILVVEDDPDFAKLVRFELETGGYEVEITSSVSEALLRMHDDGDLDLVLADVRLPGKSGLQLLFPEGAASEPPPILLMSAFISPELRHFAESMGAGVMEKPFSFAELHASVIRTLRAASLARAEKRSAGRVR